MNKGQSSLLLTNIILSALAVIASAAFTYIIPIIILTVCLTSFVLVFRKKGSTGQVEILLSLGLILLTAGSVVAYTAINGTMNGSFTGNFIAGELNLTAENVSANVLESVSTIEVWADSFISLKYEEDRLEAILYLDDGTPVIGGEITIYANGTPVFTGTTDDDASLTIELPLQNGTYSLYAESHGNSEEYINPAYATIEVDILPLLPVNQTTPGITYDPATDTITIIGDGVHCTSYSPCTFDDVYEQDRANDWGRIEKFNSYFTVHSAVKVGNGINRTSVVSERQQFMFEKPLEILQLGNFHFMSSWIQANVSKEYLMERESALYVHPGGSLDIFTSSYKVFHPFSSNNILALEGSSVRIERFTMQCIEDSCRTTFFMPSDTEMTDFNFAKNSDYVCVTSGSCLSDLMMVAYDKPLYSSGGESR